MKQLIKVGQKFNDVSVNSLDKNAEFELKIIRDTEDNVEGIGLVNNKGHVYGRVVCKNENLNEIKVIDNSLFAFMTGNTDKDFKIL